MIESSLHRLAADVIAEAAAQKVTVATAESCTGGLVSAALTAIPGSSAVFTHGFVTYANEAKQDLLGVDEALIQQHGAVSRQVAEQMAAGARLRSRSDIAISITGVAGPGGGTAEKPVGLVWFALAGPFGIRADRKVFPESSRDVVRLLAARHALRSLKRGIALSV